MCNARNNFRGFGATGSEFMISGFRVPCIDYEQFDSRMLSGSNGGDEA